VLTDVTAQITSITLVTVQNHLGRNA